MTRAFVIAAAIMTTPALCAAGARAHAQNVELNEGLDVSSPAMGDVFDPDWHRCRGHFVRDAVKGKS